ncbi:24-dehydrocholesterol reductase-like protein [Ramicandelaber brevisporus]|nr:24-dehydrocholesterol reductase-like protein [Ramicandelaber brevisporus]
MLSPVRSLFKLGVDLTLLCLRPFVYALYLTPIPQLLAKFVEKNQWLVICFFALPGSYVFDMFFIVRNWYVRQFLAAPLLHDQRVREVQAQVRRWNEDGRKKPMCTARPGWLTMSTRIASFKDDCSRISINLHDILEVDTEKGLVRCEPLVDMGQLTAHLLPMGWTLACMVEMEDLTVGGLLMGVGLEVNSHIHGFMFETVESYEVVLANGDVVTASRTENADLFHALPMSHGTLGFLVSATLKIIPCKPYMHMRYVPCYTTQEMQDKMIEYTESENPVSFVELTVYSKDTGVIMLGEFADVDTPEKRAKVNGVNHFWKPWFYKHVEEFLQTPEGGEEYIPLRHYYHRHTRSIFWKMEELVPFGNQAWYRYLFGWLGAPKVSFIKLFTQTPEIRRKMAEEHVYQDIIVPLSKTVESIDKFDELFEFYPLLFYPVRIYKQPEGLGGLIRQPENLKPGKDWEMFFDLGVYGIPPAVKRGEKYDAKDALRKMEQFTRDLKGFQLLYADCLQTKEEFYTMFDHSLYHNVRAKYGAVGAFPEVYDKTCFQQT